MGRVFFILTTLSLILALLTNRAPSAASALLNSAESGVSLMLTLLGTMTLWSGLMEVLLRTGDVAKLGLLIRKLFGRHSRALPDADCWEAIGMNLAANVLGLGNAATPPGVSAAKQLAAHGEPGLRVLALLLVLNNSGLQVLPTTVLTLRQAAGAQHPADIWGAMLISSAAVTLILTVLLILLRGKCAGVEVYGAFLSGAKKGMDAAWQLLPALTGMLLMLSLMNASGLTALLVRLLSPLTAILNLPQEVAPMLILRPMTGSGSLAALQEIFAQYGADSRVGRIASVLMGSSETIFYTMSVYLGAAGVKKLPGALGVSLLSYLTCAWVCGLIC